MFIPGNRKSRIINRKLNYRKVHGWLNSELNMHFSAFFPWLQSAKSFHNDGTKIGRKKVKVKS